MKLINSQGGINGVMINHPECDYGYKTDRGVECYDRLRTKTTAAISPFSTGVTYAILEKAAQDEIPVFTMGYGRTSAAKGTIFPWVFNSPATYWSQATSVTRYISYREGGMDKLKGKRFAFIYLDHPYGKEPIPTFEAMSKKFGFTFDKYPVPAASMTEQKSIWLQIRRTRPDYAIMWGWQKLPHL
jgi:branched-chain amino acid transport system substrate-binding protein